MLNARTINAILAAEIANATQKIIERRSGQDIGEIIFPFWCSAVSSIFRLIPGEDTWEKLSPEEKKRNLRGKYISFENFEAAIMDAQFALEIKGTDQ